MTTPSKDALRKRKARAEGRVKPRPRKGPMSLEARLTATEKSILSRREWIEIWEDGLRDADGETAAGLREKLEKARLGLHLAEITRASMQKQLALRDAFALSE